MEEQYKYDLFDRYLRGELNEQELDDFLEKVKSDADFRKALEMHQLIVEGIREHEREELRTYMRDRARVRFMGNPWSKTWTYASAAVVVGFGILYLVINPKVQDSEVAENPQPAQKIEMVEDSSTEAAESTEPVQVQEEKAAPKQQEIADVTPPEIIEEMDVPEAGPDSIPDDEPGNMMLRKHKQGQMAGMEKENDLPVKEDTRIYDTMLSMKMEFKRDSSEANPSKTLEVRNEKIQVQFWKSPINYKGYRFDGRTLQLFGLDTFNQVSLKYLVVDPDLEVVDIYLQYGENYYKLNDNNRYNAYLREKDPKIIQRLK